MCFIYLYILLHPHYTQNLLKLCKFVQPDISFPLTSLTAFNPLIPQRYNFLFAEKFYLVHLTRGKVLDISRRFFASRQDASHLYILWNRKQRTIINCAAPRAAHTEAHFSPVAGKWVSAENFPVCIPRSGPFFLFADVTGSSSPKWNSTPHSRMWCAPEKR